MARRRPHLAGVVQRWAAAAAAGGVVLERERRGRRVPMRRTAGFGLLAACRLLLAGTQSPERRSVISWQLQEVFVCVVKSMSCSTLD